MIRVRGENVRGRKSATRERDWLTHGDATELAARLAAHWANAGFPQARFWVEEIVLARQAGGYGVRSNLRNGMPPRY